MMKRPAASSRAKDAKAPKLAALSGVVLPHAEKKEVLPKMSAELQQIMAGLHMADIPASAKDMLQSMLELSLGTARDERDKYQIRVVDLIQEVLLKTELDMQIRADDVERRMAECRRAKDNINQKFLDKQDELDGKAAEVLLKKRALADVAGAFRRARKAATRAKADCITCEQEALEAERVKERVRTLLTDCLQPLNDGCDESELLIELLIGGLATFSLDESMMTALPTVLMKSPLSRGPFDKMVLASTQEALTLRLSDAESKIRDAEPEQTACQMALNTAEADMEKASKEQVEAAAAYTDKLAEHDSLAEELQVLSHQWGVVNSETVKHCRECTKSLSKLESFRQGPLKVYATLRDGTSP